MLAQNSLDRWTAGPLDRSATRPNFQHFDNQPPTLNIANDRTTPQIVSDDLICIVTCIVTTKQKFNRSRIKCYIFYSKPSSNSAAFGGRP